MTQFIAKIAALGLRYHFELVALSSLWFDFDGWCMASQFLSGGPGISYLVANSIQHVWYMSNNFDWPIEYIAFSHTYRAWMSTVRELEGKKSLTFFFFIRKEISVSWRGQWDFLLRCIGIIEIKRKNCQRRSQISRVKKLQKGIVKEWRVSISGSHLPPQKMQAKREEPGRILVLVQFPGLAHHTFTTFCIVKNCSPSPKQEGSSWSSRLSWIRCGNNEQLFLKSVMSSLSLSEDILRPNSRPFFPGKKWRISAWGIRERSRALSLNLVLELRRRRCENQKKRIELPKVHISLSSQRKTNNRQ